MIDQDFVDSPICYGDSNNHMVMLVRVEHRKILIRERNGRLGARRGKVNGIDFPISLLLAEYVHPSPANPSTMV